MAKLSKYQKIKLVEEKLDNPYWRLNNLYSIVDEMGNVVPFVMNPIQRKTFKKMKFFNIILKPRQIGMTTLIDLMILDLVFWGKHKEAMIIAHTREDAEKIFQTKIKFPYENLPPEIKRSKPARVDRTNVLSFGDSSIRVATSARSSTVNFLHISEFGKISVAYPDKADEIMTGCLNAVHKEQFIWVESTHEGGRSGAFYDLCVKAIGHMKSQEPMTELDPVFLFSAWWEDPKYRMEIPPFYEEMPWAREKYIVEYFEDLESVHQIELTDEQKFWYYKKWQLQKENMYRQFPSTMYEPFEVPLKGAFFANEMVKASAEGRITKVSYDSGFPVHTAWDLGISVTSIWWVQIVGNEIHWLEYFEGSNEKIAYYIGLVKEKSQRNGWVYGDHFLPHDASKRSLELGMSFKDFVSQHGLKSESIQTNAVPLSVGIDVTRQILGRSWWDRDNCQIGIKCLENYHAMRMEEAGVINEKPVKDWASHGADAARTFALAIKMGMVQNSFQMRIEKEYENYFPQGSGYEIEPELVGMPSYTESPNFNRII